MTIESAEEFVRLRTSGAQSEYGRAAHEDAPEAVWLEVIRTEPEMRFWVAQNKTVPLAVLALLATDPDPVVRSMVASKRKLDGTLFQLLATDADPRVRHAVVCNGRCPASIVDALATDPEEFVRQAALDRIHDS